MDKILVMQKPGARDRINQIDHFLRQNTVKILASKDVLVDAWRIGKHYEQFKSKDFFLKIIKYYTGKVVHVWAVVVDNINDFKKKIGDPKGTNGFREQLMGDRIKAIKDEFGVVDNGIHASDSVKTGKEEIGLWFSPPSLYKVYDEDKQKHLEKTHQFIYLKLQRLAKKFGAYVLFAGGTHNGMAIPIGPLDLDYRIMCPDDKVQQIGQQFASEFSGLRWDKMARDPKTNAEYIKYEIDFNGGKADVAFVPISPYRNRVSSTHLATLMPDDWKAQARERKLAAKNIDKATYKRVKGELNVDVDKHFGIIPRENFSFIDWLSEAALPINSIYFTGRQRFADYNQAFMMAKDRYMDFKELLKKALVRGAKNRGDIFVDIKSKESYELKTRNPDKNISDVLRGMVVVEDSRSVDNVAKFIFNNARIAKFEHKDSPKKDDRMGYYGPYHIDVVISGMICEIQVMTKKMLNTKEAIHKNVYQKVRVGNEVPVMNLRNANRAFRKSNLDKFIRSKKFIPNLEF